MSEWVREYYDNITAKRLDEYVACHTDDVVMVAGEGPPIVGKEALRAQIGPSFGLIDVTHEITSVTEAGDLTFVELIGEYKPRDGAPSARHAASAFFRRRDGLVAELHVYYRLMPAVIMEAIARMREKTAGAP